MQDIELIIVIPVGPACKQEFVEDTIASIQFYISCRYRIIIADDSQSGLGKLIKRKFAGIDVIASAKNPGKISRLYINLSNAYKYALSQYNFKVLLKMDTDALVIGKNPQEAALRLFDRNPAIGMAGRHIRGRLSADSYGNIHDNYWPRKQLIKDTCSWKIIRRPVANWTFRQLFFKALRNGYELGENIQGGVYFMSKACVQELNDAGLLPGKNIWRANFGEDLLFSLLVKGLGMELEDLSGPQNPVGCAWKGLPASPEQLYMDDKKLVHSIRFWQDMNEKDIRYFFAGKRLTITSAYIV